MHQNYPQLVITYHASQEVIRVGTADTPLRVTCRLDGASIQVGNQNVAFESRWKVEGWRRPKKTGRQVVITGRGSGQPTRNLGVIEGVEYHANCEKMGRTRMPHACPAPL